MAEDSKVVDYITAISEQHVSGHAREHAYRPALERLMSSFEDVRAINDPKRSENGNPDFVFLKVSNKDIILGYAEAKDITVSVDKTLNTEQLRRYAGYEKLFLTNYVDFVFLQNGEEYERISIAKLQNNTLIPNPEQYNRLNHELQAFLEKSPEQIKSGKRLSIIMGGKARRIRDNMREYLKQESSDKNKELENIYQLMKELLIHDLTKEKFADMYAQTLVYGLFAARYNDNSPADFSRREAVENVPRSNPFLRKFFDHIAGADFDSRLKHIVDELCEVFQVSNVQNLVHKHLRLFEVENEKDPIVHFYEDFLKEYDPEERKKMGAYYTPVPVVRFIIRQVDRILKEEFGLSGGLADTSKITKEIDHGQELQIRDPKTGRLKKTTKELRKMHKVQVLDPAVGTATFLNETIKYIHKSFAGQEGQWPNYVKEHLLPRLHGFELMVAPYTVAHLKLGITLQELDVHDISQRLGVYLTNTLEEGIPRQQDLFNVGLAAAVTEESQKASEIKHEHPIMVVMGNPPYSVSSNNKSKYIENLVADYKKDLNERNIQPLSDDYIKFIRFAEEMIAKNGSGIVAMITNNSYIDGLIHRQMRGHLLQTFDKIYVLDLHGNSKKKEVAPDGSKDQNVFDIMQGVGIILGVKTGENKSELAEVYHAEIYGVRQKKFDELNDDVPEFKKVDVIAPSYFFMQKDVKVQAKYDAGVALDTLFNSQSSGITTSNDAKFVSYDKHINPTGVDISYSYKPFDVRRLDYCDDIGRQRKGFTENFFNHNTALVTMRKPVNSEQPPILVCEDMIDKNYFGFQSYAFPLYLYHPDGTRTPNFAPAELSALTRQLTGEPSPEDVLDYIYAVLHSPSYRAKYKEFLKIDFPRVPVPTQAEFDRLVPLGRQLRQLHLMKSSIIDEFVTTYPMAGDNVVEKPRYEGGNVYINSTQYFGNVPETAWNFYIGGYQPAQKWLKDRKSKKLSSDDINHYQKIIKILVETNRIMRQIG